MDPAGYHSQATQLELCLTDENSAEIPMDFEENLIPVSQHETLVPHALSNLTQDLMFGQLNLAGLQVDADWQAAAQEVGGVGQPGLQLI